MSKFVYLALVIICVISVVLCKSSSPENYHRSYKQRQEMNSAKTADEWINRFQQDLSKLRGSSTIPRLYAELPPIEQWPTITAKLDDISKDKASIEKFAAQKDNNHFYYDENLRLKIQLFSALLAEDSTAAELQYRALLLKGKKTITLSYEYDDSLAKLLMLSEDRQESIDWFNKHITKSKSSSHGSHSKSKKPAWKKALAENRIDEGIKLLLKEIKSTPGRERASLISDLARLSHLLNKPKLGEQAMTMLEDSIISNKKAGYSFSISSYDHALSYYAQQGEWLRLYDICEKVDNTKSHNDRNSSQTSLFRSSTLPYQLTALYHLNKLDEFEKEISTTIKENQANPQVVFNFLKKHIAHSPSIGALYIDVLNAKGDKESKELAYNICTQLLARNQGKDAYYKRAIALDPIAADTFISSLRKYDPYEERPLIWQAEMALQAGEIDKADTLIQQAIALDPSDGDHGKFSRMHCYDVLSRILDKQGNHEKAKFFSEVLISIREGEVADDFLYAGLTQEATDRYKKALGHFNDAYCLQSRLAKTLMEAGKFDEAVPHFKKAFELMPVSFGPRESQCFGCEGLFDDKRVQNLALPTLNAFLKKEPANPRTYYLLGLLFEEMKKEPEAITAYQKAIELDPQYYNAAKSLYNLISKDPKKYTQTIKLKKQLFKISSYEDKVTYITNPHLLKNYWKLAQAFPPSPIKLAPITDLGLTAKKLSKEQFKERTQNGIYYFSHYDREVALDGWSARELLLRNSFLTDGF